MSKPVSRIGWFIIGTLFGRKDRRADLHAGMKQTLERLRQVAERQRTPPRNSRLIFGCPPDVGGQPKSLSSLEESRLVHASPPLRKDAKAAPERTVA